MATNQTREQMLEFLERIIDQIRREERRRGEAACTGLRTQIARLTRENELLRNAAKINKSRIR
jgi:hypothetical protein